MNTVYRINEVSMTRDLKSDLRDITAGFADGKIFLFFETNTWKHCWPLIRDFRPIPALNILVLEPGEEHKNIEQVLATWEILGRKGADRSSLVINIGGGMLTDLGGFIASTFKRGLTFINLPTTVLAMVDASTGGKTGINFRGLKNEIGVIRQPKHVFLYLPFLRTLDRENLLSGYAEMLKAGLIADPEFWQDLKHFNLDHYSEEGLGRLIWRSVKIKKDVVEADHEEHGIRKSLNFGHTIGHALESESMHSGHPLAHGYAVAYGMIVEAVLSHNKLGLPSASVTDIRDTITRLYGNLPDTIRKTEVLIEWMKFDKKNRDNRINFSLLEGIGKCRVNVEATEEEIREVMQNSV
ncbi:MAG: 3-dehydroquinate synthase [Porphyromonadaceae bacterium]|nr:MAG: 3-dehydroquinate synthase [Porphyromonadaceae bacterium]